MKKIIIAIMCIGMSLSTSAKPDNSNSNRQFCPNAPQCAAPYATMQQQCCCGMTMMYAPMHIQQRRMRPKALGMRNNDMVVNMRVIRSLGLDSTKVIAIRDLKRKKNEEIRDIRRAMWPKEIRERQTPADNDMKAKAKKADRKKLKNDKKADKNKAAAPTPEERKEMRKQFMERCKENREKMQACMNNYRTQLRSILGDEKYIEYLEKFTQQQQQNWRMPRHRHSKRN